MQSPIDGVHDTDAGPAALHEGTADQQFRASNPETPSTVPASRAGRWPVPKADEILVVPMGGVGSIGMNWTFYGHDGRWILVDAGTNFPDDALRQTGVDAIVPDPASMRPILGRLDGMIVTHAHEDHIGGVDRVWPNVISCPIHATPFAGAVISRRLEEVGTRDQVDLRIHPVGGTFQAGPFTVHAVRMTHSVPEPTALVLSVPGLKPMIHSGDWKFDRSPLLGAAMDADALRAYGDAGVMALVCDSTNADRELPFTSEADVREAFMRVFAESAGAVVVCCFATNVARVQSVAMAAAATGRKLALAGRSMRNAEETARSVGIIGDETPILADVRHLGGLDRREVAMACTGTQGEEKAALSRLAQADRRFPLLGHGDTVVLSARTIPGNEGKVDDVVARLTGKGVKVIRSDATSGGFPVHVSGHPGRADLRMLHELVRPRHVVPIHGDADHLAAHADLALECGADTASVLVPGDIVSFSEAGARTVGHVSAPLLHLSNDAKGNRKALKGASHAPPSGIEAHVHARKPISVVVTAPEMGTGVQSTKPKRRRKPRRANSRAAVTQGGEASAPTVRAVSAPEAVAPISKSRKRRMQRAAAARRLAAGPGMHATG